MLEDIIRKVRETANLYWGGDALLHSILHSDIRSEDLAELILKYNPQKILEIGTLRGISAAFMALINPHCEVTTIGLTKSVKKQTIFDFWKELGIDSRVRLVLVHNNVSKISWFKNLRNLTFYDLALIDGDHSYAEVCLDFALCCELIRSGAILLDDIMFEGVGMFIDQITKYHTVQVKEGVVAINIPGSWEDV
jgi:predicted O-methyltransferase YrrM